MGELKQEVYDHGGSRLYYDINGARHLIADTYLEDKDFSEAIKNFIAEYLERVGESNNV